jgi:dipeptidyl aminopeptidase/acylaminoacyl peptidase
MAQFRKVIRFLLLTIGVVAGMLTGLVAYFGRMLIRPPRQRLWATPADLGLPYEDVQFPARDGLRLSGWFIPAKERNGNKPVTTLVLVHGWPGNRLGTAAENILTDLPMSVPVELLRLTHGLHQAGYQLMMFDLRNHGLSASSIPVTFGLREADDLLGALDCLASRKDVDMQRIGAIGFSSGANTILYTLPRTDLIRAAIAVQPASPSFFTRRYTNQLLGPLGGAVGRLSELLYGAASGLRLSAIEPIFSASGAGKTRVLYVQGIGDSWGSVESVAQMVALTPEAVQPLYIETKGHFGAFHYIVDNPDVVDTFFSQNITSNGAPTL